MASTTLHLIINYFFDRHQGVKFKNVMIPLMSILPCVSQVSLL